MLKATIIVSDAEVESRSLLVDVLENRLGYQVIPVAGGAKVVDCLYQKHATAPEAVLMDVASDPERATHYVHQIQLRFPHLPIIALTNYGDMKQAARAVEAGAIDYMARPVSHQRLQVGIDNAVRQHRLAMEVSHLRREQAVATDLAYLPNDNARCRRFLPQNLASDLPLILCGEAGVGKEALAQVIHAESSRANRLFVSLSCDSLAETQLWAILFGSSAEGEEGSLFSGKLAEALGGTLFLNEVHLLSPETQSRLLQALKQAEEMPTPPGTQAQRGIRLVVATTLQASELRHSAELMPEFLAFFANEVMTLPPLRESREDIAPLARYFTEKFALQENPAVHEITPQAVALLQSYDWPGNVLELERVIFRAVLLSEDSALSTEHLLPYMPPSFVPENNTQGLQDTMMRSRRMPLTNERGDVRCLRELEADMINFALKFYDGRISEVARKLGIGRSTLYRKLHDLDIKVA